jgi:penicillin-binding protein 1C
MKRHPSLLLILILLTLVTTGCEQRPPVPKAAVRLTLTVDGLLEGYANAYDFTERLPGTPQQIAEAYMEQHQPGPLPRIFEHSVITDRNGTFLGEWVDEGRRTWMPLDRISPNVVDAMVATEDSSYFLNEGIDMRRLLGAIIQNASSGEIVSGASTLTMQLARNLFFVPDVRFDQSVERKGYETLIAQDLTRLYTKDELLEMYLNLVNFGHRSYGVEAAAQTYFGKAAADLSLAQASLIAGIPQAPAAYDPFVNLDAAKARQRIVLDLMVRHNYISQQEADATFAQPLLLAPDPDLQPRLARHFVQFLREEVQARLGDISADRAGLHITSTLDLPMQTLAEQIVHEQVDTLRPLYDLSNAALVAMKPGSAEVLVMVGSANFDDDSIDGKVNVATSLRQPGSSIKPILYATAMNDNLISPATVIWDLKAEYKVEEGKTYAPKNYDEKFHGPVTARTAMANSYNVPAVKLLDAVGVQRMLDMGRAMGLISLADDATRYGLSLTLGGGEVRLLDLTTAFNTIADGGLYQPYRAVVAMDDGAGNPVDLFPAVEPERVLTSAAAFQVTSILTDRKARVPAFGVNTPFNLSYPAAAKTGTTTSFRDNLTMGFTRNLIVGVWAGNSDGRPMKGVTGVTGAAPIWSEFMQTVISDTAMIASLGVTPDIKDWTFTPPDDVVLRKIDCPEALKCPQEYEYFSRAWMTKMARAGLTSDGFMARAKVMAVYANGSTVGVCSDEEQGVLRTNFRMPEGIGLLAPLTEPVTTTALAIGPAIPLPLNRNPVVKPIAAKVPEAIEQERKEVRRWAANNGEVLHLGPCSDVAPLVLELYGTSNVTFGRLASLAEFEEPDAQTATVAVTETTTVGNAEATAAGDTEALAFAETENTDTVVDLVVVPNQYQLIAVGPSGGCGADVIQGAVVGADGAPLAGVRVVATDQYGNRAETVSKGGGEAGRFDFAVAGSQNSYYVTVLDEAGNAISATGVISHIQPAEGPACYWVQFQAGL